MGNLEYDELDPLSDVNFSVEAIITEEGWPFPFCMEDQKPGSSCVFTKLESEVFGRPIEQGIEGIPSSLQIVDISPLPTMDNALSSFGTSCNFFCGCSDTSKFIGSFLFTPSVYYNAFIQDVNQKIETKIIH